MNNPIIRVKNLSKCYRIGTVEKRHDTLRETIVDLVTSPVHNLRKLRAWTNFDNKEDKDVIWALNDVSFDVSRGEVLGIVGRNGAGKTTLLKIFSGITEPAGGTVEIGGRLSSLLEVGTGFHPDLTGKENLYLNGAILGMRKREIQQKFDEIVSFAEIGKFIDTPVKRYSSGMYVRLAFAVAAHLEPEILLVDEVLAVGDLAFQNKCLGRMEGLAKGGRTVIFVSHNMSVIQSLCKTAIWMDNGRIVEKGQSQEVVKHYQDSVINSSEGELSVAERSPGDITGSTFHFKQAEILDIDGKRCTNFEYMDKIVLNIEMDGAPGGDFSPEFRIYNEFGQLVTTGASGPHHNKYFSPKSSKIKAVIGPVPLTSGKYTLSFSVMVMPGNRRIDTWDNAIRFNIVKCQPFELPWEMMTRLEGTCFIGYAFSEQN